MTLEIMTAEIRALRLALDGMRTQSHRQSLETEYEMELIARKVNKLLTVVEGFCAASIV